MDQQVAIPDFECGKIPIPERAASAYDGVAYLAAFRVAETDVFGSPGHESRFTMDLNRGLRRVRILLQNRMQQMSQDRVPIVAINFGR